MKKMLFLLSFLLLPSPVFTKEITSLPVSHIWEIPGGVWVPPWSGACEEASIAMVDQYYLGKRGLFSLAQMKKIMQPLFPIEDKLFGSNSDTNSTRTLKIINDFTSFDAVAKQNPTIEEIQKEIVTGHPVISLHYGYDLKNPLHSFRRGGSSYHMMVITGFDGEKKEFLVNDPEIKNGIDFRYKYDTIMDSLHDFNHDTKQATGAPVVLFTQPKQIVKAAGSHRIYLVRNNTKYYISHPNVFNNHRWRWSLVKEVDKDWLNSLPSGESINK